MEEKAQHISEILKLIANPNRLLILCELAKGAATVSELCRAISEISQSAVSQHLAMLKAAGMLGAKKEGMNVTYTISDQRVTGLIRAVKEAYCQ